MTNEPDSGRRPPARIRAAQFESPLFCFSEMEEMELWDGAGDETDPCPGTAQRSYFSQTPVASVALIAVPHPQGGRVTLHLQPGPEDEPVLGDIVEIADSHGARVWTYPLTSRDFPQLRLVWSGRDRHGEPLPGGVYWIRLTRKEVTLAVTKLVRSL